MPINRVHRLPFVIRDADSLEQAEERLITEVLPKEGKKLIKILSIGWQLMLFKPTQDVIIVAKIQRSKAEEQNNRRAKRRLEKSLEKQVQLELKLESQLQLELETQCKEIPQSSPVEM